MSADSDIETIVKTTIQTRIVAALTDTPETISKLVEAALNKPVDPNTGRHDGYASKVPYLDYLVGDLIRDAARAAAFAVLRDSQPQIEAAVRAHLTMDDMAKAITTAVVGAAGEDWKVKISFERER